VQYKQHAVGRIDLFQDGIKLPRLVVVRRRF
jgi:hypothetical protein